MTFRSRVPNVGFCPSALDRAPVASRRQRSRSPRSPDLKAPSRAGSLPWQSPGRLLPLPAGRCRDGVQRGPYRRQCVEAPDAPPPPSAGATRPRASGLYCRAPCAARAGRALTTEAGPGRGLPAAAKFSRAAACRSARSDARDVASLDRVSPEQDMVVADGPRSTACFREAASRTASSTVARARAPRMVGRTPCWFPADGQRCPISASASERRPSIPWSFCLERSASASNRRAPSCLAMPRPGAADAPLTPSRRRHS